MSVPPRAREPGAYGDFAKLMQLIVVEDCNSRTFYMIDGVFMGRYSKPESDVVKWPCGSCRQESPDPQFCMAHGGSPEEEAP